MSVIDRVEALAVPVDRARALGMPRWRSWQFQFRASAVLSDLVCALAVCLPLGYYATGGTALVGLLGCVTFVAAVAASGGYAVPRVGLPRRQYRSIGIGFLTMLALAMTLSFLQLVELPPAPILLGTAGVAASAALVRTAQRSLLSSLRVRAGYRSRAILVAAPDHGARIMKDLGGERSGLEFVGACVPGIEAGSAFEGVEVIGTPQDAERIAKRYDPDVVLVSAGAMAVDDFRRFQWALESAGTELVVVPVLDEVLTSRLDLNVVGGTPLMTRLQPSAAQRIAKMLMDKVLGSLLLLLFAPVILAGMVAVKLTSAGPAIFRQIRIGQGSRPFTMLKLRTMYSDAERRLSELESLNDGAGPLFKMADDPRVTSVGRLFRRFSIDELPQLWNVVRGDMSLVGPRPPLPREVATYDSMAVHRLHTKPGLTGLWQVSGRSDLNWEQSIKLDLRYVDNWSIGYDLWILWRTARAVLGADGAY